MSATLEALDVREQEKSDCNAPPSPSLDKKLVGLNTGSATFAVDIIFLR